MLTDKGKPYEPSKHHRRSIRLQGFDYRRPGAYFVTICTRDRICLFGKVVKGAVILNDLGRATAECWQEVPLHFPHIGLDDFIVMPNHLHGILVFESGSVGANDYSPTRIDRSRSKWPTGTSRNIGSVVRGFKIGVTRWSQQHSGIPKIWQRSYWEHVIRNNSDLNRIRQYILENPIRWRDVCE